MYQEAIPQIMVTFSGIMPLHLGQNYKECSASNTKVADNIEFRGPNEKLRNKVTIICPTCGSPVSVPAGQVDIKKQ